MFCNIRIHLGTPAIPEVFNFLLQYLKEDVTLTLRSVWFNRERL